jgi:hypothetical protein
MSPEGSTNLLTNFYRSIGERGLSISKPRGRSSGCRADMKLFWLVRARHRKLGPDGLVAE